MHLSGLGPWPQEDLRRVLCALGLGGENTPGGQGRRPTCHLQDSPTVRPASRPLCPQAEGSLGSDPEATQPTEGRSKSGSLSQTRS